MFDDDPRLKPLASHVIGMDLSTLSVNELEERVALLREEIARLEAELSRKGSSRTAAESVFRGL